MSSNSGISWNISSGSCACAMNPPDCLAFCSSDLNEPRQSALFFEFGLYTCVSARVWAQDRTCLNVSRMFGAQVGGSGWGRVPNGKWVAPLGSKRKACKPRHSASNSKVKNERDDSAVLRGDMPLDRDRL